MINARWSGRSILPVIVTLYTHYESIPEASELEDNWVPLLKDLEELHEVEIFTTNYDLIIETALKHVGDSESQLVATGRKYGVQTVVDTDLWKEGDAGYKSMNGTRGLLTKLHGSVDWNTRGGSVYHGTPGYKGNHDNQVIIYPGWKGEPQKEPFQEFHGHF